MKKTISEPAHCSSTRGGHPSQFTLNFSTPEMMEEYNNNNNSNNIFNRSVSMSAATYDSNNNTVILSPTSVNNMAVTRQLKLVNLEENCTSIELDDKEEKENNFEYEVAGGGEDCSSNEVESRSRFGRFKAKFSMKRMTSPIRRPSKNHEETLATTQSCDDHTLNTTLSQ